MNQYPSNPNRFCTQCGILCHIKLNKLITTMIIIGIVLYVLSSKTAFAQDIPPAIVIGTASYGGNPVVAGTEITAVLYGNNVGSTKTSAGGKFQITAVAVRGDTIRFTINGVSANESLLLTDNGNIVRLDLTAVLSVSTILTPSAVPLVIDNSVEANIRDPLGGALTRIFKFHNREKTWSFYDPDPVLSAVSTLKTVHSNEAYWIKVYLDTQVTLNNRSMWLYEGWNLVAY